MGPANERRRYNVTSSFICWSHTQNETVIILAFMVYAVSGLSQWETCQHGERQITSELIRSLLHDFQPMVSEFQEHIYLPTTVTSVLTIRS